MGTPELLGAAWALALIGLLFILAVPSAAEDLGHWLVLHGRVLRAKRDAAYHAARQTEQDYQVERKQMESPIRLIQGGK